ncbi:hypothetical protein B4N89_24465 [Embleya scabrispora]|uniref:FHA domain-containing protein n=1 Tax=Embleya scabrispora TaxID=159449 RepID=A0A1T3P3M3_9ACTN|nr:FHA domain-containing protein [Embleya scabrispora]OPC83673.1 hypothetical protein B4N89_24465 [Embleya scabrispora]
MWDAIVDVADVCHSEDWEPAGAEGPIPARVDAATAAWRARHGADARVELVVDRALLYTLSPADAHALRRLVGLGEASLVPVADTVILERAEAGGLHVLSGDRFLDFRRRHPWIEAHPERFHHWRRDADGVVRFVPAGIRPESPVARVEDVGDRCPDPARHPEIVRTRWRCAEASCVYGRTWSGRLPVWPCVDDGGRAVCPGCASVLRAAGARRTMREVALADHAGGASIERLPLEVGDALVLGRGRIDNGYDLGGRGHRFGEAVRYVSRQHLLLRLASGRAGEHVVAVDLGSANGTEVERWNGATYEPGRSLAVDTEVVLAPRDRLVLGGGVRVEVADRRIDAAAEAASAAATG